MEGNQSYSEKVRSYRPPPFIQNEVSSTPMAHGGGPSPPSEILQIPASLGGRGTATSSGDSRADNDLTPKDGFELVKKRFKRKQNIIGSRKDDSGNSFKSAPRMADLYIGNCDLGVNSEDICDFIAKKMNIIIHKCEPLSSKNPNCGAFKISLKIDDRIKLLIPEVWPQNIFCRKFYSGRKSSENPNHA